LLAKNALFAEILAYEVHALMKEMLWKERAWRFFIVEFVADSLEIRGRISRGQCGDLTPGTFQRTPKASRI